MTESLTAVAVCGPTASGKSDLAVKLCGVLGGEVVNLDSVQMYRGLDVGSAKLTLEQRRGVRHHLLDLFEPDQPSNVAVFRKSALDAMSDIRGRGVLPVLVGGSGMYLTVLLHGLAEVPGADDETRRRLSSKSTEELRELLTSVDPTMAERLSPRDRQRTERALEIWYAAGELPSTLLDRHAFATPEVRTLNIVLCRPRDELYERINLRAHQMMEGGLISEARSLLERYGDALALSSLGYKQAVSVIRGECAPDLAVDQIALHTRRFAKRQMTYWRNEPRKRGWLVRPRDDENATRVEDSARAPSRRGSETKTFRAFHWSFEQLVEEVRRTLERGLPQTEVWYLAP